MHETSEVDRAGNPVCELLLEAPYEDWGDLSENCCLSSPGSLVLVMIASIDPLIHAVFAPLWQVFSSGPWTGMW
jgi:hypothetical protein